MTRVPQDSEITVRFLTEPDEWVEFYQHYERGGRGYFTCVEGCDFQNDKGKHVPSQRYVANALLVDEGRVVPLQMAMTLAEVLLRRYDKYHTLLDRDYELSSEGSGLDTKYDAVPGSMTEINLARYELVDLWESVEGTLDEDGNGSSKVDLDDADDDEDDEEDEAPVRRRTSTTTRKTAPAKKTVTRTIIKKKRSS